MRANGAGSFTAVHIKSRATPVNIGFCKHTGNDWQQVATVQPLLFHPKIAVSQKVHYPKFSWGSMPSDAPRWSE